MCRLFKRGSSSIDGLNTVTGCVYDGAMKISEASQDSFRSDACALVSKWLGNETAKMYRDFYDKKDVDEVLVSLRELLEEMVGEVQAESELEELKKKYQFIEVNNED